MLFRDIRNNRRKINESDRKRRYIHGNIHGNEDRTGKFDEINFYERGDEKGYKFYVKIGIVSIDIHYNDKDEKVYMETGITGNKSMNDLVRDPDLLCDIAHFMRPLLDKNGEINIDSLKRILAKNDL